MHTYEALGQRNVPEKRSSKCLQRHQGCQCARSRASKGKEVGDEGRLCVEPYRLFKNLSLNSELDENYFENFGTRDDILRSLLWLLSNCWRERMEAERQVRKLLPYPNERLWCPMSWWNVCLKIHLKIFYEIFGIMGSLVLCVIFWTNTWNIKLEWTTVRKDT